MSNPRPQHETAQRKAAFLAALRDGHSRASAYALTATPENTVNYWLASDPAFKAALAHAWQHKRRPPAREMEMLRLVALGYTNKMIAAELHLCLSAVCGHITQIMRARKADNRAMLAVEAVRCGAIVVEVRR